MKKKMFRSAMLLALAVVLLGINVAQAVPDSFFDGVFDLANLDGTNGFAINGVSVDDNSGRSVSGAGDVNGDGIDDLIIGASYADPGTTSRIGKSYILFGSETGFASSMELSDLDGSNGFLISGSNINDYFGWSSSGAGDINGDGVGDIIIGAFWADPYDKMNAGQSYVIFGTPEPCSLSLLLIGTMLLRRRASDFRRTS